MTTFLVTAYFLPDVFLFHILPLCLPNVFVLRALCAFTGHPHFWRFFPHNTVLLVIHAGRLQTFGMFRVVSAITPREVFVMPKQA